MRRVWLVVCACLSPMPALAQTHDPVGQPTPWPTELVDPGGTEIASDLVLPMPCGASMAFQRVEVPLDAEDPLADRQLRLGQSGDAAGYAEYLRPVYLRGAFVDPDGEGTHFYIARYEMTVGQARALRGDCTPPDRSDRLAQGGLSWFDAVDLARRYTEWLQDQAREALPVADGVPGYLRLPTEAEWEFATRGGARVDAARFAGRRFFEDEQGELRDYAQHQAPGSGRGRLGPIALNRPNPLGLYDVYGNAEELMLEPFRLNVVGRNHGQTGGIVTRGGSVLSRADEIYSARRTEYPPYDPRTGLPTESETFGVRLVVSAPIVTSDARLRAIRSRWTDLAGAAAAAAAPQPDPIARLSALIAAEVDPGRQGALEELQLEFRRARDRVLSAQQQSTEARLLAGAIFVDALDENAADLAAKESNIRMLGDLMLASRQSSIFERQLDGHRRQKLDIEATQDTFLLIYRRMLDTLAFEEEDPQARETAYRVLREELDLSGETAMIARLDRFWSDIGRFAEQPDMPDQTLLDLALD
jgi:hypothetical protein